MSCLVWYGNDEDDFAPHAGQQGSISTLSDGEPMYRENRIGFVRPWHEVPEPTWTEWLNGTIDD